MTNFLMQAHTAKVLGPGTTDVYAVVRVDCIALDDPAEDRAEVRLSVWVPAGAELLQVTQVLPERLDLTADHNPTGQWRHYPTEPWRQERRDYLLGVRVPATKEQLRAAWAQVADVSDGEVLAEARVLVEWKEEPWEWLELDPDVERHRDRAELATALEDMCAAVRRGDDTTAHRAFETARALAVVDGDDQLVGLLDGLLGEAQPGPDGVVMPHLLLDPEMSKATLKTHRSRS